MDILSGEFKKILATDDVSILFDIHNISNKKNQLEFTLARKSRIKKMIISTNNPLYSVLMEKKETAVRDELINNSKNRALIREMDKREVRVASPLKIHGKVIGTILLGEKIDQNAYTKEDIEFLDIISSQAAVAIENALLYEEAKKFNVKLKRRVKEATTDLRNVNEELRTMNAKLSAAYEKLHELDRAKTEFISIASHQLRTPLSAIKGFISLLLDGTYGKIEKSKRDVLEKIFIANERLIKLVEDLLNISRIEAGRLAFQFEKGDIDKIIKEIVGSLTLAAKGKKIKLEYISPAVKPPPFYFDESKMTEVVSNLVDNAIKYTQKGWVKVILKNGRKKVRIIVADSGIGISKGELKYIFEKFQRGREINNIHTEGTGLGLFVCQKIVEAHKGRIWAESAGKGRGSRFIVELEKGFRPPQRSV